jgi:carbamoyl-phosphate synthase large subunit
MLKNKRVFVSGGNGVIGKELVKKLVDNGAIVFVGDLKSDNSELPVGVKYRQGDLNYLTKEELQSFNPEIFFHLAATFERSVETYEFWEENFWHNVRLSNHLMSLAKGSDKLRKVIFASSYLIYDPQLYQFNSPQVKPKALKESDPIYPRNLTGAAKLSHEIELRFLDEFKSKQFKTVIARIYRGYGKGSNDVISRWIRSLLNKEELTVFRKEGIYDYIFAGDTAEGLMKLAMSETAQGIYNLGTGKSKSVEEVLRTLKNYFPKLKYKEVDSDIPFEASQADMTKFKEELKWIPEQSIETAMPLIIGYEKNKRGSISEESSNCLITSLSKKVPLINEVRKATNKVSNNIKIIGNDIDETCIGKYFVDEFWLSEKIEILSFSQLLQELRKRKIGFIIPTRDGELEFWAKIRYKLEEHNIFPMISELEQIKICLDKLKFYNYCNERNIPAVLTSEAIGDIDSDSIVVKERYGAGSLKIGIKLSKEEAIAKSKKLDTPIFQPFIKGNEYSFDAYINKKREVKGVVLRKRDFVVNGESQVTTVLYQPDFEKEIRNYIEKFKFYGHVVGQFIIDSDNKINLVEINPRFGGASTLSLAAGLDSFYWFFLESGGKDLGDYPFIPAEREIRQIRYPEDFHRLL